MCGLWCVICLCTTCRGILRGALPPNDSPPIFLAWFFVFSKPPKHSLLLVIARPWQMGTSVEKAFLSYGGRWTYIADWERQSNSVHRMSLSSQNLELELFSILLYRAPKISLLLIFTWFAFEFRWAISWDITVDVCITQQIILQNVFMIIQRSRCRAMQNWCFSSPWFW